MRKASPFFLAPIFLGCLLMLQGCVAAIIPVVAAGAIGKTRVDAAKRAQRAQAGMEEILAKSAKVTVGPVNSRPLVPAANEVAPAAIAKSSPDKAAAVPSNGDIVAPGRSPGLSVNNPVNAVHPYAAFTNYVMEIVERRDQGLGLESAILIEKVSLALPRTMQCGAKPLAVIIDLDAAERVDANAEKPELALGDMLSKLREAGVRLIWMSDAGQLKIESLLQPLRQGKNAAIHADDLISLSEAKGMRKQERRWELAKYYCVVAMAGDSKADFDELYDYLLKPEYAISLEKFWNNGWFKLPHPASVAAAAENKTIEITSATKVSK